MRGGGDHDADTSHDGETRTAVALAAQPAPTAQRCRRSVDRADPSGRLPHLEAWERAKADGARGEKLMSAPAACARPERTVVEAARLVAVQNVRRLPVVDETDRLRGIVSCGDLLRIFLRRDDANRDEITGDVVRRTLGLASSEVTVEVREGQVTLGGSVEVEGVIPVIERLCRSEDGVVPVSEQYRNEGSRTPGT